MISCKERYGTDDLSFEQEMNLWDNHPSMAQTRRDKIAMIVNLEAILSEANHLINAVKTIPEDDNEYHAKKVNALAEEIGHIRKTFTTCYERHAYGND